MTDETIDVTRRRLKFRAWHRGFKEADYILGRFADAKVDDMSLEELEEFENLLSLDDYQIYGWVTGKAEIPFDLKDGILKQVMDFDFFNPDNPVKMPE